MQVADPSRVGSLIEEPPRAGSWHSSGGSLAPSPIQMGGDQSKNGSSRGPNLDPDGFWIQPGRARVGFLGVKPAPTRPVRGLDLGWIRVDPTRSAQ